MTGEKNLDLMLSTITVDRRQGSFWFLTNIDALAESCVATVHELEGVTTVVPVEVARDHGFDPISWRRGRHFGCNSSLDAVGLTAAVSRVLADEGSPCNVIARYHHDHLFVPADRAESAVAAIEALASTTLD